MSVKKRISHIVGLTADILASAESASNQRLPASTTSLDEITRLWSCEYGRALRSCLSRAEVREIVGEAKRKAWPHLNDAAVRLGSMKEFAERASVLGADFRIAKMPWPSGLAVFGFYLGSDSGLENRPLICINGAIIQPPSRSRSYTKQGITLPRSCSQPATNRCSCPGKPDTSRI